MAQTTFRVVNLNPGFKYKAGSGFWYKTGYDGGVNTQGTVDPADDTVTAVSDTFNNEDARGIFIWISDANTAGAVGDLLDAGTPMERFANPQDFVLDGDVTDPTTIAGMVAMFLSTETFAWTPNNPEYNTVAPVLKDGITANPDFDPSGNPVAPGGANPVHKVRDEALNFTFTTLVV